MNEYILMHREVPVAEISIDAITGVVAKVGELYNSAHLPVGVFADKNGADRGALNHWWQGRSIPASRSGIKEALEALCLQDTRLLAEKSFGLSLSDTYWIKPKGADLTWKNINFFENPFSEDVGNVLFGKRKKESEFSLFSPDNTCDGWLQKKWIIADGKRCLVKGGSGAIQQEPYNEVIAGKIMERLGIPHVEYHLTEEDGYPYSICNDFAEEDVELITAYHIMQTRQKENHISLYRHYLDCCSLLDIPDIQTALDQMIVLDYLIANEDRHQNNFGVLRRASSLEYLGPAPIYDSGTSLWFNKPLPMIAQKGEKLLAKPFKSTHEEQIKLVTDFSWIDFSALDEIERIVTDVFDGSVFITERRAEALCRGLRIRIEKLKALAKE